MKKVQVTAGFRIARALLYRAPISTKPVWPEPYIVICFGRVVSILRRVAVFNNVQFKGAIFVAVFLAACSISDAARAVSVEVAKKCNVLTAKAFPPREIGNPAAGSAKGTAQTQREYFNKCVANEGNMDNDAQGKK
jgi:hypothetical protein